MELTEKRRAEDLPQPRLFALLLEFLENLERRSAKHDTLVMAYMVKALDIMGTMPELDQCCVCGCREAKRFFSVSEGGIICDSCAVKAQKNQPPKGGTPANEPLIYDTNFGIVKILKYFQKEPLGTFEKIVVEEDILEKLKGMIKSWMSYHLDVGKLKSEDLIF